MVAFVSMSNFDNKACFGKSANYSKDFIYFQIEKKVANEQLMMF